MNRRHPNHTQTRINPNPPSSILTSIDGWEVNQCLVAVRYGKTQDALWRRIGRQPKIETYLGDVSEEYRIPQVERISSSRVVIRVFDKRAVDLTRLSDRLGDYFPAVASCDDCLRREVLRSDVADFSSCLELWY